jgi:hypothetical protein
VTSDVPGERPCFCRICSRIPAPADDAIQSRVVGDVTAFGWHIVMVVSERTRDWAYSIGLWHTFRRPELAIFGLPTQNAATLINQIGDQVKSGLVLRSDQRLPDLLTSGLDVACRPVDEGWYQYVFGQAINFAIAPPLPFLQVFWPDPEGRFPWEDDFDPAYEQHQPKLWLPPNEHAMGLSSSLLAPDPWPFAEGLETRVVTTKRISNDHAPVLHVYHEPNGDWQFIDDGPTERADIAFVHLAHVVGAHPTVAELADLPTGWAAHRPSPKDPWTRRSSDS